VDPHGYETRYVYDGLGHLTETHLPSISGTSSVTRSTYDAASRVIYKQMGIGAAHGIGDFALSTASAFSHIGYGLSLPVKSVSWMAGRSSFSQDWSHFQRSNQVFFDTGDRWMQNLLSGNRDHDLYRLTRSVTRWWIGSWVNACRRIWSCQKCNGLK
jgi:YD repeat-containing protein